MKRHQSDDYWKLKRLPPQTRNYVPNIMAAIFISNDPQKYGFAVSKEESMSWRIVNIDKSVSMEILSECAKPYF
jgi:membrane-bound lytic murein transglycosylase D